MMRTLLAPSERTRFTYTRSRMPLLGRMMRAVLVQSRMPMTMMMW